MCSTEIARETKLNELALALNGPQWSVPSVDPGLLQDQPDYPEPSTAQHIGLCSIHFCSTEGTQSKGGGRQVNNNYNWAYTERTVKIEEGHQFKSEAWLASWRRCPLS